LPFGFALLCALLLTVISSLLLYGMSRCISMRFYRYEHQRVYCGSAAVLHNACISVGLPLNAAALHV
jgi:hypothetical protein